MSVNEILRWNFSSRLHHTEIWIIWKVTHDKISTSYFSLKFLLNSLTSRDKTTQNTNIWWAFTGAGRFKGVPTSIVLAFDKEERS